MAACRRGVSMKCAQGVTQCICAHAAELVLSLGVCRLPQRVGLHQQRASGCRQGETAAAAILFVDRYFEEPATFERFEVGGQCCAVHREQRRDAAETRGFRPIERHQQRELAVGETERPEHIVETPRQRPGRAMHVQTQATVADHMGRGEREKIIFVVQV